MWCSRKNCLGKAEWEEHMKKRRENKTNNNSSSGDSKDVKVTKDFKIALSAMMTEEDFKKFEKDFLGN